MILVDGGHLAIKSNLVPQEDRKKNPYDTYQLTLNNAYASLIQASEWNLDYKYKDQYGIIEPFDINIFAKVCKIESEEHVPIVINGDLPAFRIKISPARGNQLIKVAKCFAIDSGSTHASDDAIQIKQPDHDRPIIHDPPRLLGEQEEKKKTRHKAKRKSRNRKHSWLNSQCPKSSLRWLTMNMGICWFQPLPESICH